ncbi:tRNA1(Val) (adenine(37)-N6)-methyltransferase [Limisalsivibrio acetivorans]|uniref:tRNA1(Val) (adenine(37)-N6)-methyltransferase n=1 Tax=Limisalsivibrio acetivorans TaxID=1304888 RepID=UPI0003B44DA3|nr:methyltransferase [Limisalsivibrio acetivorans]
MNRTLTSIIKPELLICQPERGYRFSVDSLILADFVSSSRDSRIIDIGAGSGVISAVLASIYGYTDIISLELQSGLYGCLEETVRVNGLDGIVKTVQGDVRDYVPDEPFDAAVCNPPYRDPSTGRVPEGEEELKARFTVSMEPADIFRFVRSRLRNKGSMFICIDADLLPYMFVIGRENNLEPKRLRLCHNSIDTPAVLALIEFRKGGRPELRVEPPLIQRENGVYTSEMRRILGE